jgi:hypothetical protein
VFDFFHDVPEKAKAGNANAKAVLQAGPMPSGSPAARKCRRLTVTVFKVPAKPTPTTCRRHRRHPPGHPAARPGHAEEPRRRAVHPKKTASAARSSRSST